MIYGSHLNVLFMKVPLLLVEAYSVHNFMHIPNPPAKAEEQARYAKDHKVADTVVTSGPLAARNRVRFSRYFQYTLILWELLVLVILALFPSTRIPRMFLLLNTYLSLNSSNTSASDILLDPTTFRPTYAYSIGLIITCAGGYLRMLTFRSLGHLFTLELSLRPNHRLVTTGPYALVRHPSYLALVCFVLGQLVMLGPGSRFAANGVWECPLGWAIAGAMQGGSFYSTYSLLRRIPLEDAVLRKEFKEEWEAYAKRTPYRVMPFVY